MEKRNFQANECSRQFVENPQNRQISDAEWIIVDRLPLEKYPWQEWQEQPAKEAEKQVMSNGLFNIQTKSVGIRPD